MSTPINIQMFWGVSALVLEVESNILESCFPFQSDFFSYMISDLVNAIVLWIVSRRIKKKIVEISLPYFVMMCKLKLF